MTEDTGAAMDGDNSSTEGGAPAEQTQETGTWLDGFQDQQLKEWAEGKQFPNPEAAVKSGYHAEKMVQGSEHYVRKIGDHSTPEEVNEFYSTLGRPDEASAYGFAAPEGADSTFADAAKGKFHELGLTDAQAVGLNDWWGEQNTGAIEQSTADYETSVAADTAELRKEWGAAFDKNETAAKAAAREFGLDETQIDGMEKALGFGGLMRFMSNVGSKLGQDDNDSADTNTGSEVLTPDAARVKMGELQADPNWVEAFFGGKSHPGHADAVLKKANLSKLMSGVI